MFVSYWLPATLMFKSSLCHGGCMQVVVASDVNVALAEGRLLSSVILVLS